MEGIFVLRDLSWKEVAMPYSRPEKYSSVGKAGRGVAGHTGDLINPACGVNNAEPVIQIPVGLPCLERGHQ